MKGSVSYTVNTNQLDPVGHPTRSQVIQENKDILVLRKVFWARGKIRTWDKNKKRS